MMKMLVSEGSKEMKGERDSDGGRWKNVNSVKTREANDGGKVEKNDGTTWRNEEGRSEECKKG